MNFRRFLEVLLISAFIFLCQGIAYSETDNSLAPAGVKRGKAVYERYCLGCHGARGNGKGPFATGLNP
ncbi:MAG TPA: c-type cytochrome, partial [Nitrospiria bacterium]|nr:c-type cytochrome [Nitrospiria bacterium]